VTLQSGLAWLVAMLGPAHLAAATVRVRRTFRREVLSVVGLTNAVQANVTWTAVGAGAATAQTDAFETDRAALWAVAIDDALIAGSGPRLAEAARAFVAGATVARRRAGRLTQAVETTPLRPARAAELAEPRLGPHRLAGSEQTRLTGFAVAVAATRSSDFTARASRIATGTGVRRIASGSGQGTWITAHAACNARRARRPRARVRAGGRAAPSTTPATPALSSRVPAGDHLRHTDRTALPDGWVDPAHHAFRRTWLAEPAYPQPIREFPIRLFRLVG